MAFGAGTRRPAHLAVGRHRLATYQARGCGPSPGGSPVARFGLGRRTRRRRAPCPLCSIRTEALLLGASRAMEGDGASLSVHLQPIRRVGRSQCSPRWARGTSLSSNVRRANCAGRRAAGRSTVCLAVPYDQCRAGVPRSSCGEARMPGRPAVRGFRRRASRRESGVSVGGRHG